MLRIFRPDLLCGLGGFVLGAAALLLTHGFTAGPLPRATRHVDVLVEAQAAPPPQQHFRAG